MSGTLNKLDAQMGAHVKTGIKGFIPKVYTVRAKRVLYLGAG